MEKHSLVNKQVLIKSFSSLEEANLYCLKKDIDRCDIEKLQMFCKMLRISKMLSSVQIASKQSSLIIKDEELLKFWSILNKRDVKYIIGGGWAVNVQGFSGAVSPPELWLRSCRKPQEPPASI